jgi:hypothetical protein
MHEEQQAHHPGQRDVRHDHQPTLGQAVDHETAEGRGEAGECKDEEHEPRRTGGSRQRLHPDA